MAYAIMRCKKISSAGGAASALRHCYREQETPNADSSRTAQNEHLAATSTDQAMGRLRELLPAKRRKDAVLAVEYVMTASPEWWMAASEKQQQTFFRRSMQWLAEKFGQKNIITATIHRDETSPHLSAFVVPLTRDGRLSAKELIGDKGKMSRDQTSFAEQVRDLGLQRGLEGSRARHTTIRQYYSRVNAAIPSQTPSVDLPEPRLIEGKEAYGERVAESVLSQMAPEVKALRAKAQQTDLAEKRAKLAEQRQQHAESKYREVDEQLAGEKKKVSSLVNTVAKGGQPLVELQASLRRLLEQPVKQQEQVDPKPKRDRGPSR